ncbi:ferritin family protein [Desulfovibrio inopinatus]|uniref:ferritin family protein n=1 Tax=Desulfovibrio inopinatus TaxID=102109 RepID=UPI00041D6D2F|nr:ferritin family protein [Desulfovibrio inopinatus]
MTSQTARDVIDQTKAFHKKLGNFYQELSDKVERERVKILLEYMSRHHDNLAAIMDEYEESVSESILDTWFMYVHKECDLTPFFDANLGSDMTAQQVIKVAMELDQCLLETYEAMLQNEIPDNVSEVFQNMLEMEKQEKIALAKDALMIEDM